MKHENPLQDAEIDAPEPLSFMEAQAFSSQFCDDHWQEIDSGVAKLVEVILVAQTMGRFNGLN